MFNKEYWQKKLVDNIQHVWGVTALFFVYFMGLLFENFTLLNLTLFVLALLAALWTVNWSVELKYLLLEKWPHTVPEKQ